MQNLSNANIILFRPQHLGFIVQGAEFKTFQVNFKRIGVREYRINTDGIAILKCMFESNGRTLRTEPCPFCKTQYHIHSLRPGHRLAHCGQDIRLPLPDGDWVSNVNGYVLELVSSLEVIKSKREQISA